MSALILGSAAAAAVAVAGPASAAQTVTNVAYAPADPAGSRGHLLDLYLPSGSSPTPLVIWTSGSAWTSDDGKSGASSIASTFNAHGYAVAGVSVRSSSQAKFPAQVYDIKSAIRWLRAHAAQYNLDPNKFVMMGDSSGGWETDMATLTGGVSSLEGSLGTTGVSSSVQAGVSFFGPTDFLKLNAQRLPGTMDHDSPTSPASSLMGCAIQTCPTLVEQANPITYVDANDPPMMLLHGTADQIVPSGQTAILYDALKAKCLTAEYFSVPGANHGTSDVMNPSHFGQQTVKTTSGCRETTTMGTPNPTWDTIIAWVDNVLGKGGSTNPPTQSPTQSPTQQPTQTATQSPTQQPTTRPTTGGACTAVLTVTSSWSGGFVADVSVKAGSAAIGSWTVTLTLPSGTSIASVWSGTATGTSGSVTVHNAAWNGQLAAGAATSFGFQGTGSASGATVSCAAA